MCSWVQLLTPENQTNFYITESSAFRNKVLYFRQDDWRTLCAPLIERLKSGTFEKISEVRGLIRYQPLRLTVSLFSQTRKSYSGNANWVSRSFGCYQKILESGLSSTSDGESTHRYSINPSLIGGNPYICFRMFLLPTDQSIKSFKRPFRSWLTRKWARLPFSGPSYRHNLSIRSKRSHISLVHLSLAQTSITLD